jgi:hypothetical protein
MFGIALNRTDDFFQPNLQLCFIISPRGSVRRYLTFRDEFIVTKYSIVNFYWSNLFYFCIFHIFHIFGFRFLEITYTDLICEGNSNFSWFCWIVLCIQNCIKCHLFNWWQNHNQFNNKSIKTICFKVKSSLSWFRSWAKLYKLNFLMDIQI